MSNKAISESKRAVFRSLVDDPAAKPDGIDFAGYEPDTLGAQLHELGVSRRAFMQFCAGMASLMAMPPSMGPAMAATLLALPAKPSVLYLSFQECTGCLESLVNSLPTTKANSTSIENLILNLISLDYQETLMAAAGDQVESWLELLQQKQGYVLIVDGSIPNVANSGYFVSHGQSGVERFRKAAANAGLIIAVGTCASFGGLPKADPNPTGAVSIGDLLKTLGMGSKPLINVSGCPPIPEVITGVIMYYLTKGMPELDTLKRPKVFYGETVHDGCYREEGFEDGPWVERFDDANARKGACLFHMGCKGPVTHNACSKLKWNQGVSFPIQSGHGCIGCSEPNFWDMNLGAGKGFYVRLPKGSFHD
jgi:hydrogenase small subunit